MRLENAPDFTVWIVFCSSKACVDLRWMVGIVINDSHSVKFALVFKTAVCAVEIFQSCPGVLNGNLQNISNGEGGKRIGYVVVAVDG